MNRKQFLCSVAGASLTEAIPSLASGIPKSPLALTILSTSIRLNAYMSPHGETPTRCLKMSPTTPHFNVAIQNISQNPIRLWNEDSSWGSGNLTLEISAVGAKWFGAPIRVERKRDVWYSNMAQFSILYPGEMIMREVTLEVPDAQAGGHAQKGRWPYKGFPLAAVGLVNSVQMRAVYEILPDKLSAQENVWTGKIISPENTYVLYMTEFD